MTTPASDREKDRIRQIASLLYQASRSIRVLSSIDWPPEVKAEFFAEGAKELPQVNYQPLDPEPAIEAVRQARRAIVPATTVDLWLERQADTLGRSARMLAAVGTNAFFEYGRQIYGEPTSPHRFYPLTSLELAGHVRDTIEQLVRIEMDIAPPDYHEAPDVARDIERSVGLHFGDAAPRSSWLTSSPPTLWPRPNRSAFAGTRASRTVTPASSCTTRPTSTAPRP